MVAEPGPLQRVFQGISRSLPVVARLSHVGMRLCGFGERIDAADIHGQRPVSDPVEELPASRAKQLGCVDVIEEGRVAEFDALRQAHDVERSWPAEHWTVPTEGAGPAKGGEGPLERFWPGSVINDIDAISTGQVDDLVGKITFRIDDHMIGAGLSCKLGPSPGRRRGL
jgi:hypothetical protein